MMPATGEFSLAWLIAGAGLAAAISIASVWARLLTVGERDSHCGRESALQGGVRWVTNDVVNIACTAAGAIMAGLVHILVWGG